MDEIIPAVHGFQDRGAEFLRTPDAYDGLLRTRFAALREKIPDLRAAHVLADHDQWGYLLQPFTRAHHEGGTLFFEIVQRQGSRRFDSADIRACTTCGKPAARPPGERCLALCHHIAWAARSRSRASIERMTR